MRVLVLANNWVGWQVTRWLSEQQDEIVGVVLHPSQKQKYGQEILACCDVKSGAVFDGSRLRDADVLAQIQGLGADIAVSVLFGYILRPDFLKLFPAGCINLHPSLLPYNRGAHPNVWSIIEGSPAGTTLHYIDPGVDTGDIIAQLSVEADPTDTGETLYRKLETASVQLFKDTWPLVRAGQASRYQQAGNGGCSHRAADIAAIDEIDPEASYKAKDLINLIRARTFAPYPGAFFRSNGRKIFLRLDLSYDNP
jgi:methionyl-tRNA formyltransferase